MKNDFALPMTMSFTIPGKPFGKERPRVNTTQYSVYTPPKTVQYEERVRALYMAQGGRNFRDCYISIAITAFFKPPKATTRKQREAMRIGNLRPAIRPDADNICKVIMDSLQGIAFENDKQVIWTTVEKRYDDEPRVDVEILAFERWDG